MNQGTLFTVAPAAVVAKPAIVGQLDIFAEIETTETETAEPVVADTTTTDIIECPFDGCYAPATRQIRYVQHWDDTRTGRQIACEDHIYAVWLQMHDSWVLLTKGAFGEHFYPADW